jgi:3-deoxy-D-arabino-heptulosonate 7-phosphate (DAHP) synthase class II
MSAHFIWIVDRTRQLGHAHVEFCRGIANPIGVKVGPSTGAGVKTRRFDDVFTELGSYLGGMHLELTGEAVTECVGGSEGLGEDDLSTNYMSFCDLGPNEKQALEMAFLVADHCCQGRDDLNR